MIEFIEKNPALTAIFIFVAGIVLSIIGFFIKKLFTKNNNKSSIKVNGNVKINGGITVGSKNTNITNINPAINYKKEPFLILYVRNIKNYPKKKQKIKEEGYLITHTIKKIINNNTYEAIEDSDYFLRLRNEGEDVALNVSVEVEGNNFIVSKYQNKQLGLSDEQSIKVIREPNNKIRNPKDLDGQIFTICCNSKTGDRFCFEYMINDIESENVKFLGRVNDK